MTEDTTVGYGNARAIEGDRSGGLAVRSSLRPQGRAPRDRGMYEARVRGPNDRRERLGKESSCLAGYGREPTVGNGLVLQYRGWGIGAVVSP